MLQSKEGDWIQSSGMHVPGLWFHFLLSVARWSTSRRVTRSRYSFVSASTLELLSWKRSMMCLVICVVYLSVFFWQVAASTQKEADAHIPNYPSLPSRLVCLLENVTLHVCSSGSMYFWSIDNLWINPSKTIWISDIRYIKGFMWNIVLHTLLWDSSVYILMWFFSPSSGGSRDGWGLCTNDLDTCTSSCTYQI